jgi:DNA polymerase-3 subunit epsilon
VQGYAVIDVETTGPFSADGDRIIEVAIVHVDPAGRVTGAWDTLVNPARDLGRQDLHRIRASDAALAPTFAQIAPELCDLLAGRVVVAHDADFGNRFLTAELDRIGHTVPPLPELSLCTLRLAGHYLPGVGSSLADCTAALGLGLGHAHGASADAFATAEVLGAFIRMDPLGDDWLAVLQRADAADWPRLAPSGFSFTPRPRSARPRAS